MNDVKSYDSFVKFGFLFIGFILTIFNIFIPNYSISKLFFWGGLWLCYFLAALWNFITLERYRINAIINLLGFTLITLLCLGMTISFILAGKYSISILIIISSLLIIDFVISYKYSSDSWEGNLIFIKESGKIDFERGIYRPHIIVKYPKNKSAKMMSKFSPVILALGASLGIKLGGGGEGIGIMAIVCCILSFLLVIVISNILYSFVYIYKWERETGKRMILSE